MLARWRSTRRIALVPMLVLGGPAAFAQGNGPWVDPPTPPSTLPAPGTASLAVAPPDAAPQTPPGDAHVSDRPVPARSAIQRDAVERPEPRRGAGPVEPAPAATLTLTAGRLRGVAEHRRAARAEAASRLAIAYLNRWSGPNPAAVNTAQDFYGSSVLFHGRPMSSRALEDEKRRFVQRWPVRRYQHRPALMTVACEPGGQTCTVRSIFDFTAVSPSRGRRSDGVGALELVVSFAGERPVIAVEESRVLARSLAPDA